MKRTTFYLNSFRLIIAFVVVMTAAAAVNAQSTAFTYQGRLTDSNGAANGSYSMQFRLYGVDVDGIPVGPAQASLVTIANGIFTVKLDFGPNAFASGGARWLEVQVGATILSPRQEITSAPMAIRSLRSGSADSLSASCVSCVTSAQIESLDGNKVNGTVASATNSTQLGGVAADQYVRTSDPALTNVRALNNRTGNVIIAAGSNLTLTTSGNTLTLNTASPLLKKFVVGFDLTAGFNVLITHNLGTQFIRVVVYKLATNGRWEEVPVGSNLLATQVIDDNSLNVAISFLGSYRVIVIG